MSNQETVSGVKQKRIFSDGGSATVEFSMLAIPLFIPIFLYLNSFASLSYTEVTARSLVRQMVRAFAISENPQSAEENAFKVLKIGGAALGYSPDQISHASVEISCENQPCWRPGERVKIELRIANQEARTRQYLTVVSAQEYISPWR